MTVLIEETVDDLLLVGIERTEDSGENLEGKTEIHVSFNPKAAGAKIRER